MASSGNIAFNQRTNRRILPVGTCWQSHTNAAHVNPIGYTGSSSPIIVDVQQYQTANVRLSDANNLIVAGVTDGVTNSQFGGTQSLEASAVLNWSGFLRIQIADSHTLVVGNVLTIDQLNNQPYAVIAVINASDFVISAPYAVNAIVGEFFFKKSSGEVVNNNYEVNPGRLGGMTLKPNRVTRIRSDNRTSLIRGGAWNQIEGYWTNSTGGQMQPANSNLIASGYRTGSTGIGDTNTGTPYRQHAYFEVKTIGTTGDVSSFLVPQKIS